MHTDVAHKKKNTFFFFNKSVICSIDAFATKKYSSSWMEAFVCLDLLIQPRQDASKHLDVLIAFCSFCWLQLYVNSNGTCCKSAVCPRPARW